MENLTEQGSGELADLRRSIEDLELKNEDLLLRVQESMADVSIAIDDQGWSPLGGMNEGNHEIPLSKVKKTAELCRALVTVNPLVKQGVNVRTSFIWGDGVKISVDGSSRGRKRSTNKTLPPSLERVFGSTLAQAELERSAASDGNWFFLCDTRTKTVTRLPFWQISGAVTQNGDSENILYIRRTWDDTETDLDTGTNSGDLTDKWYPTSNHTGPVAGKIMNVEVESSCRIVHVPFNRIVGWRWGIPDTFTAIFWSKAYKEFLENCATLTKAYARFAWKVTSASGKGTARVASQLASEPGRDPITGQSRAVGASVALGAGQDLTAISRSTSVDFNAGRPLAAMVAAGLGVPLPMLTSDPGEGSRSTAETLDEPTKKSMKARQRMADWAIKECARMIRMEVTIEWPDIDPEPTHRLIQAIDMAGRSGVLFPKEWREMLLEALGEKWLEKYPERVPNEEQVPLILKNSVPKSEAEQEKEDQRQIDLLKAKADAAPPPVAPAQGGKPGAPSQTGGPKQPDPPSRGDKTLRDQGGQAHTDR